MTSPLVGNAHLVAGGAETVPRVLALLGRDGIEARGNPDLYVREHKRFGINEARELSNRASLRPLGGVLSSQSGPRRARRVFVIIAADINREAQNALLKTIEEPPAGALFFFIVPNPETLLPTFRSRAHTLTLSDDRLTKSITNDVRSRSLTFLKAMPQERLDLLKPLLEKGDDDKRDIGAIISFLASLERALAASPPGLRAVYRARKYVADKGALVKTLLEQVALLVPRV